MGRPHKIAILDLDAPMIFTPGRRDLDLDASNLFKKNYYLQDLRYLVPCRSKKEGAVGRTIYDFNELLFWDQTLQLTITITRLGFQIAKKIDIAYGKIDTA